MAFLATPDDVTYTVYAVADDGSELQRSVWVWLGALGAALRPSAPWPSQCAPGGGRNRVDGSKPERRAASATEDPWDALDRGEDPTG